MHDRQQPRVARLVDLLQAAEVLTNKRDGVGAGHGSGLAGRYP